MKKWQNVRHRINILVRTHTALVVIYLTFSLLLLLPVATAAVTILSRVEAVLVSLCRDAEEKPDQQPREPSALGSFGFAVHRTSDI